MEKSIIVELALNGKGYIRGGNVIDDKEYRKCSDEIEETLTRLCKGMTEEEKRKTIMELEKAQGELEAITADEYFKQGFKLGLTLAAQNFLD